MRAWKVAGALIEDANGHLLLVCNRRRDGSHDWTTPGGVIEDGEHVLAGLAREVAEETGLVVEAWEGPAYTVEIEAPDLGWVLSVEAHRAVAWTGELLLDDPDGIVVEATFVAPELCAQQLGSVARWVSEPLLTWMGAPGAQHFAYTARGTERATLVVTRR